jgi:hypothetical protein
LSSDAIAAAFLIAKIKPGQQKNTAWSSLRRLDVFIQYTIDLSRRYQEAHHQVRMIALLVIAMM